MTDERLKKYIAHLNRYLVGRKIVDVQSDLNGRVEKLKFDDGESMDASTALLVVENA